MVRFYCKLGRCTYSNDNITLAHSRGRHIAECWKADAGRSGWVVKCLQAREAPWTPEVETENGMMLQTLFCYLRMAMAFLPHLQGTTYIKIGSFKINTQDIHFLLFGGGG